MPGTSSLRVYYDADADRARLRGRTVAIIGYGSQGHAHALNLRDSGDTVIVGLRPGGASWARAAAEGLDVRPVADAARAAHVVMMLVPDQHGRAVYEQDVAAAIVPGKTLMFAHGFNVEFKLIVALMSRGGMKFMRYSISDTAEYGDYTRGPTLITPAVRARMQQILADIQSGAFAREWIEESRQGGANFQRMRREQNDHLIERVGATLRAMMPWSEEGKAGLGVRDSGLGKDARVRSSESRAPNPEPLRA